MSQMPYKIWLHKDTKYSTADGVFGYQYECAQEIESEGIENFVVYIPKEHFIYEVCEWLEENLPKYWSQINANNTESFIEKFRKAMEEYL